MSTLYSASCHVYTSNRLFYACMHFNLYTQANYTGRYNRIMYQIALQHAHIFESCNDERIKYQLMSRLEYLVNLIKTSLK